MCGICGFAGQGSLVDLQRMTGAMIHRGPDAEGLWHDPLNGVYLGHRRLSIIDLESGAQPMWTAGGHLGVIFNGEIYNHLELRAELIDSGLPLSYRSFRYRSPAARLPPLGCSAAPTAQRYVGLCHL